MFYIMFVICFFLKICYTAVLVRSHEISTDYYNSIQATQYKPENHRLSHEVIQGKDLGYLPIHEWLLNNNCAKTILLGGKMRQYSSTPFPSFHC